MSFQEYTLPDGTKLRHGQAFRIEDVASFPANWLELATRDDLNRYNITVETLPDPVSPPPPLQQVKRFAKREAERLALRASVSAVITQAEADIDAATTEAEVQAVLDAI